MRITIEIPDSWPKGKDWRASGLMKCEKDGCSFITPDAGAFLNHLYQVHLMDELTKPDLPETLTTAP
jgi:hypothetical protein